MRSSRGHQKSEKSSNAASGTHGDSGEFGTLGPGPKIDLGSCHVTNFPLTTSINHDKSS